MSGLLVLKDLKMSLKQIIILLLKTALRSTHPISTIHWTNSPNVSLISIFHLYNQVFVLKTKENMEVRGTVCSK